MATLKDIAQQVGISVSAASMALRNHRSISDETKRRVWEAQQALGYKLPLTPPAELAAESSPTSVRDIVFLLIDRQFDNPTYARSFQQVADGAAARHWRPIYLSASLEKLRAGTLPPLLQRRGIDGLVVSGCYDAEAHRHLSRLGIPMVVLGRYRLGSSPWASCEPDLDQGMRLVIEKLAELGHRRIGLYTGATTRHEYCYHLVRAYHQESYDMESVGVAVHESAPRKGELDLDGLLDAGVSAIIASGGLTALFATLEKRGVVVPRDLSLVTFGGKTPEGVSVARVGMYGNENAALRKLATLMEEPETTVPSRELFHMQLLSTASLGPCPGKKQT